MYPLAFPHTFPLGSVAQRRPLRGQGQGQMAIPVPGQPPAFTFGKHPAAFLPTQPAPPNMAAVLRNNSFNMGPLPPRPAPQMFEVHGQVCFLSSFLEIFYFPQAANFLFSSGGAFST